jgi:hypothetical protein
VYELEFIIELHTVLPYWAIYRRLGYFCESFATEFVSSLHFISATFWATLGIFQNSITWQSNPSNQSLRFSNFCLKFSQFTMEAA